MRVELEGGEGFLLGSGHACGRRMERSFVMELLLDIRHGEVSTGWLTRFPTIAFWLSPVMVVLEAEREEGES